MSREADTDKAIVRRLSRTATAIRTFRLLRALCLVVGLTIIVGLVLATVDWWVRFESRPSRWIATLSLLWASIVAMRQWIGPAWSESLDPVRVAWLMGRRRPDRFDAQFVAGVALAWERATTVRESRRARTSSRPPRTTRDDAALVSSVIATTWHRLIDWHPLRELRWTSLVAPLLLMVGAIAAPTLIAVNSPSTFGVGVMRLINPVGRYRWPTRHDLSLLDPVAVIAAGTEAEVTVVDRRRRLNAIVRLEWETDEEPKRSGAVEGRSEDGASVSLRLPPASRDLRVRARAADSVTGWRRIRVVPETRLVDWTWTAFGPSCRTSVPTVATGNASLPRGAELSGEGKVGRPLSAARLVFAGEASIDTAVPLDLSLDGLEIRLSRDAGVILDKTTNVRLVWVDREGVPGGSDTMMLTASDDPPPLVERIDDELRWDDRIVLPIGSIWSMRLSIADEQGWSSLSLEQVSAEAKTNESADRTDALPPSDSSGRILWSIEAEPEDESTRTNGAAKRSFDLSLPVDLLDVPVTNDPNDGAPSGIVAMRAIGLDRCGGRGIAGPWEVEVVTRETYARRLERVWGRSSEELREWRRSIETLRNDAEREASSTDDDRPAAARGEQRTRRAAERLEGSPNGPLPIALQIVRWGERHGLERTAIVARMRRAERTLRVDLLGPIALQQSRYAALLGPMSENDVSGVESRRRRWLEIADGWRTILETVDRLIESSAGEDRAARLGRLRAIADRQAELTGTSIEAIGRAASGTAAAELSAESQRKLAEELERWMTVDASALDERSQDELRSIVRERIAEAMRTAAGHLAERRPGAALPLQQRSLEALRRIVAADLANDPSQARDAATERAERRNATRRRIAGSRREVSRLIERFEIWSESDPSLNDRERRADLSGTARRLSDVLQRMVAGASDDGATLQERLGEAAEALEQGATAIEQGDRDAARERLDRAQAALSEAAEAASTEAADDSAVDASPENPDDASHDPSTGERQIEQRIAAWSERQLGIADELHAGPPASDGTPSDRSADGPSLWWRSVARREASLADELRRFVDEPIVATELPVLGFEIREIADEMVALAERLERIAESTRTENPAESTEAGDEFDPANVAERIARRLSDLLATTGPAVREPDDGGTLVVDPGQVGGDAPQAPVLPSALRAELVRLRRAQQRLNERTIAARNETALADRTPDDATPADERLAIEARRLAASQRGLSDSAMRLVERLTASSESPPSAPPGNTELPGLPGLPGLPNDPEPNERSPETDDADESERRRAIAESFEPVTIGMEEATSLLERVEIPPAIAAQQRTIEALDRWLGGAEQPDRGGAGSNASSSAGSESGVTAVSVPADAIERLPTIWRVDSGAWGHLPERLQRSLGVGIDDAWIPGYEGLSIEYFRQLGRREE